MAASEQDRRGFATMAVETLKGIWDQDYDNILYIPQEAAQPVRGWAGVEQYYKHSFLHCSVQPPRRNRA